VDNESVAGPDFQPLPALRLSMRRHAWTHPPDRGEGAAQAPPPVALRASAQFSRHREL